LDKFHCHEDDLHASFLAMDQEGITATGMTLMSYSAIAWSNSVYLPGNSLDKFHCHEGDLDTPFLAMD